MRGVYERQAGCAIPLTSPLSGEGGGSWGDRPARGGRTRGTCGRLPAVGLPAHPRGSRSRHRLGAL